MEILNRASKTKGSYKNSFNVEYKERDEEENNNLILKIIDINESIQIELENWKQNQVYDEIPSDRKQWSVKIENNFSQVSMFLMLIK